MLLITLKLLLIFVLAYVPALAVYRLYFHPLAKFPGPKLAALTNWYARYFDVYKQCQFYHEITAMHREYGPIVRIGPNSINVHDLDFFDEIFCPPNRIRDRPYYARWALMKPDAGFCTLSHALHKKRRASLNVFFSQRAIVGLSGTIFTHIEKLLNRLEQCYRMDTVVELETVYTALTIDVITDYCFGEPWAFLDAKDYNADYRESLTQVVLNGTVLKWFPLLGQALYHIPDSTLIALNPQLKSLLLPEAVMKARVKAVLATQDGDVKGRRTIFSELLDSDLPPSEKTSPRLTDEALVLVGAGAETTAKTLVQLTFHLISQPAVLEKLRTELRTIARPGNRFSLTDLQQLPYFTAVVYEGLRLFGSLAMVQSRVCPNEALLYKNWKIPSGTEVSELPCALLHDGNIFPDPQKFIPERWIGLSGEEKHLRSAPFFSAGARNCLGVNLAYAELYLTIAALFTKFDMELVDTTAEHVKIKYYSVDGIADPKLGGVKIKIRRTIDG